MGEQHIFTALKEDLSKRQNLIGLGAFGLMLLLWIGAGVFVIEHNGGSTFCKNNTEVAVNGECQPVENYTEEIREYKNRYSSSEEVPVEKIMADLNMTRQAVVKTWNYERAQGVRALE